MNVNILIEWEEVSWRKESECKRRLDPYEMPYTRTYRRLNRQEMKQIWGDDKDWRSDFNLYRFLTTLWYCGYEGKYLEYINFFDFIISKFQIYFYRKSYCCALHRKGSLESS